MERRLRNTRQGAEAVDLLHQHRVAAVRVLMNPDGRRAALAAFAPVAKRTVTSDDVLDYRLRDEDVANVERLLAVSARLGGKDVEKPVAFARRLLSRGAGKPIRDILK